MLSKRTGTGYNVYEVEGEMECECMDFRFRGGACKHILAVKLFWNTAVNT